MKYTKLPLILLWLLLFAAPSFAQAPGVLRNAEAQVDKLNEMIVAGNPALALSAEQRERALALHVARIEMLVEVRASDASDQEKTDRAVASMREVQQEINQTILRQEQKVAIRDGRNGVVAPPTAAPPPAPTRGTPPAANDAERLPDTFAPLSGNQAPQSKQALWAGYDPRAEPLETEIVKEWEQDGVVLRIVRYRVGVFKGRKAVMAAVYGFPKGGTDLPGLVQIHGGGQYAHYQTVLNNAKRGYATVAIAWAGRIDAPDYRVSPAEVKLFWDGAVDHPDYKLTTDWGAVDGYHAPSRFANNAFIGYVAPAEWTIDPVPSPRNNGWFLCTVGARRALTFLEQQTEVDDDRLGVYGHSMGGKLTVLTTGSDDRVKVSAPSCGGISDRYFPNELFNNTIGDHNYLADVTCPIAFLMPVNDFHGRINDLPSAVEKIQTDDWRVTSTAHLNHKDHAEAFGVGMVWLDQHLKGRPALPSTPTTQLELKTKDGVPRMRVTADPAWPIVSVDVYYTQQGEPEKQINDRTYSVNRFWHHAELSETGENKWSASLPLYATDRPLWAYANVTYALAEPVTGSGYYFQTYTAERIRLSSLIELVAAEELRQAGVRATLEATTLIEDFAPGWEAEWFTDKPEQWPRATHKVFNEVWKAPAGARLTFAVRAAQANDLVIVLDDHAAEVKLKGGDEWQTVSLTPADFLNAKEEPLAGWDDARELTLTHVRRLKENPRGPGAQRVVGKRWDGADPEFKELRWKEE